MCWVLLIKSLKLKFDSDVGFVSDKIGHWLPQQLQKNWRKIGVCHARDNIHSFDRIIIIILNERIEKLLFRFRVDVVGLTQSVTPTTAEMERKGRRKDYIVVRQLPTDFCHRSMSHSNNISQLIAIHKINKKNDKDEEKIAFCWCSWIDKSFFSCLTYDTHTYTHPSESTWIEVNQLERRLRNILMRSNAQCTILLLLLIVSVDVGNGNRSQPEKLADLLCKRRHDITDDKFRKISMDQYFGSQSASQCDAKKKESFLGASFLFHFSLRSVVSKDEERKNVFIFSFSFSRFLPIHESIRVSTCSRHRWQEYPSSFFHSVSSLSCLSSLLLIFCVLPVWQ